MCDQAAAPWQKPQKSTLVLFASTKALQRDQQIIYIGPNDIYVEASGSLPLRSDLQEDNENGWCPALIYVPVQSSLKWDAVCMMVNCKARNAVFMTMLLEVADRPLGQLTTSVRAGSLSRIVGSFDGEADIMTNQDTELSWAVKLQGQQDM
ncbi:hypothetical protein HGM15179_003142 [Zosterops borbonicus]|uniref:Uncharacterized protein n=1 Tax=Zosterops borbonicus TaxID=364589 RepID=A0A8K1GRJ1_9PASS|nr:hypothetical protein HGM15179_003142 [Zosterops borbonicus]